MCYDLTALLSENTYPGRGIVIGKTADGKHAAIAYFIMGRSENSRNRIFEENEDCGIRTRAYDESKLVDPSLIIYSPVRKLGDDLIVTNGDQTDTVYDFIKEGKTFEDALRTRTFEPDAPNFTPRISGIATVKDGDFSYKLSILKSDDGNDASVQRFFYEYAQPVAGKGHFIHTYRCDGNPIPSFSGDPEPVEIPNDLGVFTAMIWKSLNEQNKVSLFTRFIDLTTGEYETRIINKHE
ncbi:IMP cyclohydrolase [Phocea massiliensis]|uniref:IMP cyclohydrolase n=1 Tax=Merdimmobilis hominis TaxID=2897707 RepID=A0A938X775_9FIRM|nr:IMP cyclohydrolase [Merdimmobilis hominis]MBM6920451.1 IMP cyclohydrolase [Merdimmobilis hominis]